jgi:predicted glycosyltransferase
MKTLWFDIGNTPHVHFLSPIIDRYRSSNRIVISVRDYSETINLAQKRFQNSFLVVGKHGGRHRFKKVRKLLNRLIALRKQINHFDFALSCGGFEACFLAKLRNRLSIVFDDNDISPNWIYSHFASYSFLPDAIPLSILPKQGFEPRTIYQYHGFKEDIYLANYEPNPAFLDCIPWRDYVVVRPENKMANYIRSNTETIVPILLRELLKNEFKVLYLPRTQHEREYAYGLDGVFVPRAPVNGLDASFFSRAVTSGAGSLTREAACLGKPAVSFYPGRRLLAVDKKMIQAGMLIHSRNPKEIVDYVKNALPRGFDRERSKDVQRSVFKKLDEIIHK